MKNNVFMIAIRHENILYNYTNNWHYMVTFGGQTIELMQGHCPGHKPINPRGLKFKKIKFKYTEKTNWLTYRNNL